MSFTKESTRIESNVFKYKEKNCFQLNIYIKNQLIVQRLSMISEKTVYVRKVIDIHRSESQASRAENSKITHSKVNFSF